MAVAFLWGTWNTYYSLLGIVVVHFFLCVHICLWSVTSYRILENTCIFLIAKYRERERAREKIQVKLKPDKLQKKPFFIG